MRLSILPPPSGVLSDASLWTICFAVPPILGGELPMLGLVAAEVVADEHVEVEEGEEDVVEKSP